MEKINTEAHYKAAVSSSSFQVAASLSLLELVSRAKECMNAAWAAQPGPFLQSWAGGPTEPADWAEGWHVGMLNFRAH